MRELKVITVCGAGVGTSTLLRVNLNKAFKAFNLPFNVKVENTSISRAKGTHADLIVSFPSFARELGTLNTDVIFINNLMDQKELSSKIEEYLKNKELI